MEHKISPLYIYITITRSDNEEVEEDYSSNEKTKRNQQWEEQHATIKLLNIVETIQVIERFTWVKSGVVMKEAFKDQKSLLASTPWKKVNPYELNE